MPKTSLELLSELHNRSVLSKEAAARIMATRDKVIKRALVKEATAFFKSAGFLGIGGEAKALAEKEGGGFAGLLNKFKGGALTPRPSDLNAAKGPGWSDITANLAKVLGLAGLTAGATAGVGALIKSRREKSLNKDVQASYQQMFEEFPQLKEMDKHKVDAHFGVLAEYAPSLAANPIVAGSYVASTTSMGMVAPAEIKLLADAQRHIDESAESHSPIQHIGTGLNVATRALNPYGPSSGGQSGK